MSESQRYDRGQYPEEEALRAPIVPAITFDPDLNDVWREAQYSRTFAVYGDGRMAVDSQTVRGERYVQAMTSIYVAQERGYIGPESVSNAMDALAYGTFDDSQWAGYLPPRQSD